MKKFWTLLSLLFVAVQADPVNGWEPLHEAVFADDLNKTREMVEQKHCDIDAQSKAGISALHIAVKTRNLPMVIYLVEHGADVDIQDNNGYTPLLYAVAQRRIKIVKYLVMHDADVNEANHAGITPLQQAAYSNAYTIVDYLLKHGADPDLTNANGVNACELAYLKGNFAIAHYLKSFTHGVCGLYLDELNATKKENE
ncbi:ankyrin repeat domain-containing protein [Hydrogenimonas sp. SS33]|uniref:ankyrin repeat domain-containing protein n=1 Tax=Hydrogenimonas leucolamina TaxID=2954236 RepID=UPI00336BD2F7